MNRQLVYVMGPSGAGKDAVLGRARAMLPADAAVTFAHRYITRPADIGGENFVALTRAEFALRRASGLFAYHWHAHGNDYGIGREIRDWMGAGMTVVVSGSREHFQKVGRLDPQIRPVLITASIDRLEQRLFARSRETATEAAERLGRAGAYDITDARLVTIVNDGALDEAATAFVRLLSTLESPGAARRRAENVPAH